MSSSQGAEAHEVMCDLRVLLVVNMTKAAFLYY